MKVLFIGMQDIFETVNNGGSQVAKRNFDLLSSVLQEDELHTIIIAKNNSRIQNERVKYFPRTENNVQAFMAALWGRKFYTQKSEKGILRYIEEYHPDIIFFDSSNLGKLVKKSSPTIKKIVFFHNIESEYSKNKVKNEGFKYFLSYIVSLYNEKAAVYYGMQIVCLNERDSTIILNKYGKGAQLLLPISFADNFDENKVNISVQKKLLFIGSLFQPNYQGIRWFIDHVMSELVEFQLVIVGKGFEVKREELERKNVTIVGTVECLEEYYYEFPAVVMPILYGNGMKVKTAEAMMYGKHIFATKEALEGYRIESIEEGIYCCDCKEEFITKIRETFAVNRVYATNYAVRNCFLDNYCTNQMETGLKELLDYKETQ